VNEDRLRKLLADQTAPGEAEAMERGWRVASSGFDESPPAPPRRVGGFGRLATAGAAAFVLIGVAFTPPGEAVTDWIGDAIRPDAKTAPPPLRLPAEGRLLVNTAEGPWIVQPDGSKRLLGHYEDASWSPAGRFVVASRGRQLAAIEPGGRVRWTRDASQPVSGARWAPSGYRIAYLTGRRTGFEVPPPDDRADPRLITGPRQSLRVVAGDGTDDRRVASHVAEAAPAWRPGLAHVLAYADLQGAVVVVNTDTGKRLWRERLGAPIRQLAWSADGQRLVALTPMGVHIVDAQGRLLTAFPTPLLYPQPLPAYSRQVAFARRGHRFALIRANPSGRGTRVVTLAAERFPGRARGAGRARPVFSAPGAITEVEWSPDGEWLLIAWTGADQWVFDRAAAGRDVRTVSGLADRFDAGSGPEMPSVSGWCCAVLER
jgi:dipeptidyl aminopeptidase/acylaminoacyl peptidase